MLTFTSKRPDVVANGVPHRPIDVFGPLSDAVRHVYPDRFCERPTQIDNVVDISASVIIVSDSL